MSKEPNTDPIDRTLYSMQHLTPSAEAQLAIGETRRLYRRVVRVVARLPLALDPRCEALALTRLEEALMWTIKGIVIADAEVREAAALSEDASDYIDKRHPGSQETQ